MIVLTVVTASRSVRVGLRPPRRVDRLRKGLPNLYLARSFRGSVPEVARTGPGWSERSFELSELSPTDWRLDFCLVAHMKGPHHNLRSSNTLISGMSLASLTRASVKSADECRRLKPISAR